MALRKTKKKQWRQMASNLASKNRCHGDFTKHCLLVDVTFCYLRWRASLSRFLFVVMSLMLKETRLLPKGFFAFTTLVGFFFIVDSDMLIKV